MLGLFRIRPDRTASQAASGRTRRSRRRRPGLEGLEGRQLMTLLPNELIGNEILAGAQVMSVTASTPDGRSVVAWVDRDSSGVEQIEFRLFNKEVATTTDRVVPGSRGKNATDPAVAMDEFGNFVIVWTQNEPFKENNVVAQRYSAAGNPIGSQMVIGGDAVEENRPDVGMDRFGNFVVAYTRFNSPSDPDVVAKRYRSDGFFLGEAVTDSLGTFNERNPSVAMAADGRYTIAYQYTSDFTTSGGSQIWMLTYDANLNTVLDRPERSFPVATGPTDEVDADVAINNFGEAVVVFARRIGTVGNNHDVVARRVPLNGAPSTEITILKDSFSNDHDPQVAMNRTGRSFVVTVDRFGPSSSFGVDVVEVDENNNVKKAGSLANVFNGAVSMGANGQYQVVYETIGADKNVKRKLGNFSAK